MSYVLEALTADDAPAAAEIHAEGQPGTFLTRLGSAFLTEMYRQLALAPECFGFVAHRETQVLGVVVGIPAGEGVLKRVMLRGGRRLLPSLLGAVLRHPSLIAGAFETLRYGDQFDAQEREAELLFIGVRLQVAGEGIGRALFSALAEASRRRGMCWMSLIVDDGNPRALRFYQRNGMTAAGSMTLHGRKMHRYLLELESEEVA